MELYFLVDVNLPKYFKPFNFPNFQFVADINLTMTDTEIWSFALDHNLIIITKDTDFYSKYLLSEKPPKIIYFQIGNKSLKALHHYFELNWEIILKEIKSCNCVIATENNIKTLR